MPVENLEDVFADIYTDAADGRDLTEADRHEEAIELYDRAIDGLARLARDRPECMGKPHSDPSLKDCGYSTLATVYTWRASSLVQLGRLDEARRSSDLAVQHANTFADAHLMRATAYAISGMFDKALGMAEKSISMDPDSHDAYVVKATALINTGRPVEAMGPLEEAERTGPGDPAVYPLKAAVLGFMRRDEEALVVIDEGLRRSPEDVQQYQLRSVALSELGNYEGAREAAETAARLQRSRASSA